MLDRSGLGVTSLKAAGTASQQPWMSRRRFMARGGALAATAAGGLLATGCAVPGGQSSVRPTQLAPGVVRVPVGGMTVTAISDGSSTRPLAEGFVRNAPLAQVQAALREAGLPTETITITFTTFLVDTGAGRVLMDTGNGQFGGDNAGRTLANMAAAGIDPRSIDTILITHFHGDHINGIRDKEGRLAYPNAKIMVPAPEWDFWMDDARMAAAPEGQRAGFQNARRVFAPFGSTGVQRFVPGQEAVPGIQTISAFGHTPGHTAFAVRSRGAQLVYWGDLTNIAALFIRNPDWALMFDMDAEAARATRRRMLEAAVNENWMIAGFHLESPGIGRIVRRGTGFDFVPVTA